MIGTKWLQTKVLRSKYGYFNKSLDQSYFQLYKYVRKENIICEYDSSFNKFMFCSIV